MAFSMKNYDDYLQEPEAQGSWPWEFTAEIEMDIPELGITLEGRCMASQEHEGADDFIDWWDFYESCTIKGIENVNEFFDENEIVLTEVITDDQHRKERTSWIIKDRS